MIAFIAEHRDAIGVEPICRHLPIAPSTFYDHMAKRANPDLLSERAKRDVALRPETKRIWEQNDKVYGLFKAELSHRRGPWRSFSAVEYATRDWVDWFSNRRLLDPIGHIPPAEAEANFYAALEKSDMAA